jgi:hypothetical protein
MGTAGAERTSQLNLYYWEDLSDFYNHIELYSNWLVVDAALVKKRYGGTANFPYGDYAEDIRFAGTSGLGSSAISVRAGTVTGAGTSSPGTLSAADTYDRFNILTGGTVNWGSGTAATDVALYRNGNSVLKLSGTLESNAAVLSAGNLDQNDAASSSSSFLNASVSGDTYDRFSVTTGGSVNWGSGVAATDVNLYRSGVGTVATDGVFATNGINTVPSGGTLTVYSNVKFTGNKFGFFGSASTQSTGWGSGPTNVSSGTKTYDANAVSIGELADTLGNLIVALRNYGILGA